MSPSKWPVAFGQFPLANKSSNSTLLVGHGGIPDDKSVLAGRNGKCFKDSYDVRRLPRDKKFKDKKLRAKCVLCHNVYFDQMSKPKKHFQRHPFHVDAPTVQADHAHNWEELSSSSSWKGSRSIFQHQIKPGLLDIPKPPARFRIFLSA
ncbi:hypothetical protein CF319_g4530 [Tilletia indica]|nr:hypothetical protein CF319_g4530 [Tilletia indica]